MSTGGQPGETEAFTLLVLHFAFDLFTQPEATIELLRDIYVCRQKAAKKQKAKREEDGGRLSFVRQDQVQSLV